jgi:hypothetical protein
MANGNYEARWTEPCHEEGCKGTLDCCGLSSSDGEILKFYYLVCDTCGWDQYS